jgi:hypothetical protein
MKQVNYKVNVETKSAQKNVEDLNKDLNKTSTGVKETQGNLDGVSGMADKATGGMVSGFRNALRSIKGVNLGFKSMKFAIISTGIGALVVILGSLAAAFASSEAGQNKFNKLTTVMGAAVGNLMDLLADLGDLLIWAFEQPEAAITKLGELIKQNLLTRLNGLLTLLPSVAKAVTLVFQGEFSAAAKVAADSAGKVLYGVESITDAVVVATEVVGEFIEEQKRELAIAVQISDFRAKADKLERNLLIDRAKADRDRAELLNKAVNKEKFDVKERISFLEEAALLEEAITNKEIRAASLRLKAIQKENTLSRSNKEALDEEANAKAKLIQLETSKLSKAKLVTTQIVALRNEEKASLKSLATLEQKLIDERIKKEDDLFKFLSDAQATAKEKEVIALVDKYDKAYQLALGNNEAEKQLAEQQKLDLAAIDEKYADIKIVSDKKIADDAIAEAKRVADAEEVLKNQKIDGVKNTLTTIGNLAQLFAGESEEQQKKAFKVQKAVSIAQALIDTYASATAAFKSLAGVPVVGVGLGIAAAAAAVTGGLLNVKQIASTEFQGSGASGGGSSPSYSASTGSTQQAPDFNVVGQSGFNQVATALGQNNDTPIQAFVVSGDVTTAQQLDNNIIQTATF